MEKQFTVAILGVGARGGNVYGRLIAGFPEKFKIVALCDIRQERLDAFGKEFNVKEENRFTDEKEFFKEKRADLLVIATQDQDHVRNCLQAFEKGYDILMEKPITDNKEECKAVLAAQKKYGCKALICHVLRYAPAFLKAAELIETGKIGRLVAIDALERVTYWHQAHSYVRGNWRTTKHSRPRPYPILCRLKMQNGVLRWRIDLLQCRQRARRRGKTLLGLSTRGKLSVQRKAAVS